MKIFGISSINTELLTKEEKIEKIRNQKQIIVEKEMERKLVYFLKIIKYLFLKRISKKKLMIKHGKISSLDLFTFFS